MKLATQTDYALRVLMQVALSDGELVRIADVALSFALSHNHLMKVVHRLGALGYLETVQGRGGGLRLARPPSTITVGEVVRDFETDTALVECFDRSASHCRIQGACVLQRALRSALDAFLGSLDAVTLADLLAPRRRLANLLTVPEPRARIPGRADRRAS
ncbi:MAG: Rrf2 family transcriptional regulator [Gammaproteobacteria bacterium]|nr:Rrf2 family transcriptional regulator [Gammaproteobacteria bacterium]